MKKRAELKCDWDKSCTDEVEGIDEKGFVFCKKHLMTSRDMGKKTRFLLPWQLDMLADGKTFYSWNSLKLSKKAYMKWLRVKEGTDQSCRKRTFEVTQKAHFSAMGATYSFKRSMDKDPNLYGIPLADLFGETMDCPRDEMQFKVTVELLDTGKPVTNPFQVKP